MSNRFNREQFRKYHRCNPRNRKRDHTFFGIIIIAAGIILLLRTLNIFYIDFSLSWPVIVMVVGLLIGIKSRFHNPTWWILMVVGLANLTPQFMILGQPSTHFIWPAILIIGGAAVILRPRRLHRYEDNISTVTNAENTLNIDVTFGGRKEIVTSKDFRGGVVSTTFGGTEINLMQADSTVQPIIIDFKVSFGGVELIVPSHWELQNEINSSFGSVEDERVIRTATAGEEKKTLLLRGTCSFGSIEIKSY